MSSRASLTSVVHLIQGYQLGETMKRLRIWLDSERIEPSDFKTAVNVDGYTFTIGFRRAQDAKRFRAQFGD